MNRCCNGTQECIKINDHKTCHIVTDSGAIIKYTGVPESITYVLPHKGASGGVGGIDGNSAPQKLNTTNAVKYDTGKVDMTYISYEFMYAVSKVREFGAKKYSRDNWKNGTGVEWVTRNFAALLRHTFKRLRGEILDPESNLPHTWHIACCIEHIIFSERNEETGKIE